MARVSVDKTLVKLGEEIYVRVDRVPPGWSGEIAVNGLRHFLIHTQVYALKATIHNGFNKSVATDLFVALNDFKGYEIPVANRGHLRITVVPAQVSISPADSNFEPGGGSGMISVTAPPGYRWPLSGVPDWMTITGDDRAGEAMLSYTVAENTSNEPRSAAITIGDAAFEVTQRRNSSIVPPYQESFIAPPRPVWAVGRSGVKIESNSRWVVEDQAALHSKIGLLRDAPGGGNSLIVERKNADPQTWKTQIYLPGIQTETSAKYRVSLWLKAQNRAPVGIAFGQRTAPYSSCGLSETIVVPTTWTEFSLPFRATGQACDAANNRLSIQAGGIAGKLWIAKFSITSARVGVDPANEEMGPAGGAGVIHIDAKSGYKWSVTGVPEWIKVTSSEKGAGSGTLAYRVAENAANERRSAVMTIGDAAFEIAQQRPSSILLPYQESFGAPPAPVWTMDRRKLPAAVEPPTRWILDEQPGPRSIVNVTAEAPGGGHSLVVERQSAGQHAWTTQIYLPGIKTEAGAGYRLSLWLKAQNPAPVSITFGQRTAPYSNCGLSQTVEVSTTWTEFKMPFRTVGEACSAANNRLSIGAGQIAGKLWIAKFSLTPVLFSISPENDKVGAGGGSAQVRINAASGHQWSVTGVPDWIAITAGASGSGNGVLRYKVSANTSNQRRSAALNIGDAVVQVTQPSSAYTYVPFFENFSPPPSQWIPEASVVNLNADPPNRWVVLDQAAQRSSIKITADAPHGGNSLVLERPQAEKEAWKTQIYLPRIQMEEGAKYRVSLWLKAQNPGLLWLEFGQRTAPYHSCGLSERVWVASVWSEFTFQLQAGGRGCGGGNNRLSLHAGGFSGKLWLARISLVKESPLGSAAEPRARQR